MKKEEEANNGEWEFGEKGKGEGKRGSISLPSPFFLCLIYISCVNQAETAPHEGKRKNESVWEIFRISHQREKTFSPLIHKIGN